MFAHAALDGDKRDGARAPGTAIRAGQRACHGEGGAAHARARERTASYRGSRHHARTAWLHSGRSRSACRHRDAVQARARRAKEAADGAIR